MISDDFFPAATGVGVYLQLVCKQLVGRGYRVSIITSRRAGEPEQEDWQGVTVYRVFTVKLFGFYQALPSQTALCRILTHERPNVIHHHYLGIMMMRVCAVAESLGLPQVATYHFSSEVLTQPWPMRPLRGLIRRLVVRYNNRFNLVLAPSQNLARQIAEGGIRTPVRYLTNPVAFGATDTVVPTPRSSGFTILYAGRLGVEKNLPYLLRGFAQLVHRYPDAVLWVAGRGPEQASLEHLSTKLGIANRVRFLGFLDHPTLAKHYAACDAFVLPSLLEAQSLVTLEAMWFAKPVIVTNAIVSAAELVEAGVNGFVVDPASPADLAERLRQLACDPALRIALGAAGRQRALACQPEPVIDSLVQSYREVMTAGVHG